MDAGGGGGVNAFEFGAAGGGVQGGEFGTELWIGLGAVEETFEEGLDVEVGAADDNGRVLRARRSAMVWLARVSQVSRVKGESGFGSRGSGFGLGMRSIR